MQVTFEKLSGLVPSNEAWPVDRHELQFLSDAYIDSRYPRGGVHPIEKYTKKDAEDCGKTVKVIFLKSRQ